MFGFGDESKSPIIKFGVIRISLMFRSTVTNNDKEFLFCILVKCIYFRHPFGDKIQLFNITIITHITVIISNDYFQWAADMY